MNLKLLPITLIILAFNSLAATACPEKAPNFLDYQRRNSNRCEGIVKEREDIGTGVYLVSFATRQIDNYNQPIRLRIPKVSNADPNLQVNSYVKNYKLDEIKLSSESAWFSFNWDSRKNPAGRYQLRYVAEIQERGQPLEKITRSVQFEHNPDWLE